MHKVDRVAGPLIGSRHGVFPNSNARSSSPSDLLRDFIPRWAGKFDDVRTEVTQTETEVCRALGARLANCSELN